MPTTTDQYTYKSQSRLLRRYRYLVDLLPACGASNVTRILLLSLQSPCYTGGMFSVLSADLIGHTSGTAELITPNHCVICMWVRLAFSLCKSISILSSMDWLGIALWYTLQASGTLRRGRRQSLAIGRLKNIFHLDVYSCIVFAMAYNIAHVCVADLD